MKIYHYDRETGEHVHTTDAVVLPRREELSNDNPNKFQLPAHATFERPPKTKAREAACHRDGKWIIVPDFRKESVYSRRTGEQVGLALGEHINMVQYARRPVAPSKDFLAEKREEKIAEVAVEMALRSEKPLEIDVAVASYTFHADWVAAMRIMLALMTLKEGTTTWTPKGQDEPVIVTRSELEALLAGIVVRMDRLHNLKKQKEQEIKQLTTLKDIAAYDVTSGWDD